MKIKQISDVYKYLKYIFLCKFNENGECFHR